MTNGSAPQAFFDARATFMWKSNRKYRVYVMQKDLIFIRTGSGEEVGSAVAMQFGLLGMLVHHLVKRGSGEPVELPDDASPEDMLGDHKHNFRMSARDVLDMSIDLRSAWQAFSYGGFQHVGVLRFAHRELGKFVLEFPTVDDMYTAIETLPKALGNVVKIYARWDEQGQKFVRK